MHRAALDAATPRVPASSEAGAIELSDDGLDPALRLIEAPRLENIAHVADDEITVRMTRSDIELLIESLDSHEYWQIGDVLPRKNGEVFIPGDMEPDLIWEDDEPTAEQRTAIDKVLRCRELADRLNRVLDRPTADN
jgi:hypothetical protein